MADITFENSEQLLVALGRLPDSVLDREAITRACLAGARILAPLVAVRAPLETGFLKANIVAWGGRRSDLPAAAFVTIRRRAQGGPPAVHPKGRKVRGKPLSEPFYAKFLERGTEKMRARPFFAPAFTAGEERAVAAVEKSLQRHLDAFLREVTA